MWAMRQAIRWLVLGVLLLAGYTHRAEIASFLAGAGLRGTAPAVPSPSAAPDAGPAASRTMTIRADASGHFIVDADVNGTAVHFMVDTGATTVVLTPEDAKRIGLRRTPADYTLAFRTAGGVVRAAPVILRAVSLGPLHVDHVEAAINAAPIGISLLGMSFLSRLDGYAVQGGRLILSW
jgi:aspartyl protease family protein